MPGPRCIDHNPGGHRSSSMADAGHGTIDINDRDDSSNFVDHDTGTRYRTSKAAVEHLTAGVKSPPRFVAVAAKGLESTLTVPLDEVSFVTLETGFKQRLFGS